MTKRGRPRLDRPAVDLGTPELIHKRLMASPKDAAMSTTPLDVLKSRLVISEEAHTAASYFAALRKIVFGKAHPGAIDLTAVSGRPNELDIGEAEDKYRQACAAMKAQSRRSLDAVENLVVHERWPGWLSPRGGQNGSDYKNFGLGIAALLGWYRGRERKAA